MSKQYHLSRIGHRLLLDWRKKRAKNLEKLLEQKENDQWVGSKLDFFAGIILAWVLMLVFFNHFVSMQLSLYLSVLGPIAFSWLYHRGRIRKQQLIAAMKKEREHKAICLANINTIQQDEADKLTVQLGKMLGLNHLKVVGQGIPIIGEKDGKKVALYLDRRDHHEEVSLNALNEFIELTKNQDGQAGVYFTSGSINSDLIDYVKRLSDFKVKLVGSDKLVLVLKNMEHPYYEQRLVEQRQEESVGLKTYSEGNKKLLQMFVDKPALVRKYIFVSITLTLLSLLMSNWLKLFYLFLAAVNLALAIYTYYKHLPNPEEEQVVVDDLW